MMSVSAPSQPCVVTLARPVTREVAPAFQDARELLRSELERRGHVVREVRDQSEVRRALTESDAVLVHPPLVVGEDELAGATHRVRVVATAGAGLDHLDLDALRRHGVEVVGGGGGLAAAAVAEHTLGLILALTKRIATGHAAMVAGNFEARWTQERHSISGRTIGIVGWGRIGQRVGAMCAAIGMRVLVWESSREGSRPTDPYPRVETLDALADGSDVVSIHVPLTAATRGLIGSAFLNRVGPGAWLVNTSRGGVIDQDALIASLANGRLAGAALDVFDAEPPVLPGELVSSDKVLLSPHCAGLTVEAVSAMSIDAAERIDTCLRDGTHNGAVHDAPPTTSSTRNDGGK